MSHNFHPGHHFPLGATVQPGGTNFCVYSRHATLVELLLFHQVTDTTPHTVIRLEPGRHRSHHYWHAFVEGIGAGQHYGFRVHGPKHPEEGHRFDPEKLLIDPYSTGVATPPNYDRLAGARFGDNTATAMKSVVIDPTKYDWEGDAPLRRPNSQTVIYEMHARGFTANPNSGVPDDRRGTYLGLIDKIPYLVELGITAVEFLPVMQFDPQDAAKGHLNYWGYSTVSFFAPHAAYATSGDPTRAVNEFRDMVKALHRAGIEVILDVVYNHTAEGSHEGPTFCFRGFDNAEYYILDKDKSRFANYTGCGNTVNTNHSVVRRLILDSLRYWVQHMHVDGFRFDLAAIFSRDHKGRVLRHAPVVWEIESDPVLAAAKIIAEPWDCGGLNQVGAFAGDKWQEWNDRFRDDVRRFVRGDGGAIRNLSKRILGSPDLYEQDLQEPEQSINFITAHDGFTLNDLYTYDKKHNEANGEENRDGSDNNLGWNCGVDGPTDDPAIEEVRHRLCRNALAITLLSLGTPMFWMGDEVRRSQQGNNNAYCQDNEIGWFDWSMVQKHADLREFVRRLIDLRQSSLTSPAGVKTSLAERLRHAKIRWHGTKLRHVDWSDESRCLAVTITTLDKRQVYHYIFNGSEHGLDFELPRPPKPSKAWYRLLDTALPGPDAVARIADAPPIAEGKYHALGRTLIVLTATTDLSEEEL